MNPAKLRAEDVKGTFLRMGVNPIELLCKIAKSRSKTPVPEHVLKALTELCRYYAPRLSTQAITGRIDSHIQFTEAVQQIMVSADEDTIHALEAVSLKLDALAQGQRRADAPEQADRVIDITPQLLPAPEAEDESESEE